MFERLSRRLTRDGRGGRSGRSDRPRRDDLTAAIALAHLPETSCLRVSDHPAVDPPVGPPSPSVFAVVANTSGTSLLTTKPVLIAFSRAMEEELAVSTRDAELFAFFQRGTYFAPAEAVWRRLAHDAASTHAFGDFDADAVAGVSSPDTIDGGPGVPTLVHLPEDAPMRHEWAIVVERPSGPMALSARERPGQRDLPEAHRLFDSTWTTHPATVRKAALLGASIAAQSGSGSAAAARDRIGAGAPPALVDPGLVDRLLDRLLSRLDRLA